MRSRNFISTGSALDAGRAELLELLARSVVRVVAGAVADTPAALIEPVADLPLPLPGPPG